MDCLICQRIEDIRQGKNPYFIKEFQHSFLVLGDHQFFKGYCLHIMKDHVEDLADLDLNIQNEFMSEVLMTAKFLKDHFKAKRMNYSCLGNFVPHVHFHLFPRYEEDLKNDETKNPWHCIDLFASAKLSESEAKELASKIRISYEYYRQ